MAADQRMALWKEGLSDLEIARRAQCSVSTVCRWRLDRGLHPNRVREPMPAETKAEALRLFEAGVPLREISDRLGVFVETLRKLAIRSGVQYERSRHRTSAKEVHGTLGYGGYVELRVDRDGPYGNLVHHGSEDRGYAPLHRMRMQDKLGRQLQPGEIVHHVDGDIYNNSPQNLELFASVAEHLAHHREEGVPARCKEAADRWP